MKFNLLLYYVSKLSKRMENKMLTRKRNGYENIPLNFCIHFGLILFTLK